MTQLRTIRWMKQYGYETEMRKNMRLWLDAWTNSPLPYGQELDPFSGHPSKCSPYYSSTMLFYLYSACELLEDTEKGIAEIFERNDLK